jgi:hypothetical protein
VAGLRQHRPKPSAEPAQIAGPDARNIVRDRALLPEALRSAGFLRDINCSVHQRIEFTMATRRRHDQITETPTEARQAEPGPSVLALLAASTGLAILILGALWFVFFRV